MKYEVRAILPVRSDTVVAISPRPANLKIGRNLWTADGLSHKILSVGLGNDPNHFFQGVDLLVEGQFGITTGDFVAVK